ncbi:MAG: hypothetical protein KGL53_12725 [Elusimicrobia bacterium]|nr:hypothetical protein [Elusimicrobiota bacterium]
MTAFAETGGTPGLRIRIIRDASASDRYGWLFYVSAGGTLQRLDRWCDSTRSHDAPPTPAEARLARKLLGEYLGRP